MKRLFLLVALAVLFAACQTDKKPVDSTDDAKSGSKATTTVGINYDTESGIPELEENTDEAVQLTYNFEKGASAALEMDYEMTMEMMGQRMPMKMKIDAEYNVDDVTEEGNAILSTVFKRFMINMDGPQPMKFDSDVEADLESEIGTVFKPMINNAISTELTEKGELISFNIDKVIENMDADKAAMVRQQVEPMSSQFAQNAFVSLPDEPVKVGDVYDAGTVETGSGPMQMKMNMKYKILGISKDKNIVIFEPDGTFDLSMAGEEGAVDTNENTIKGWIVFNLDNATLIRSFLEMKLDVSIEQMGQKMPLKMEMNVKMASE